MFVNFRHIGNTQCSVFDVMALCRGGSTSNSEANVDGSNGVSKSTRTFELNVNKHSRS